MLTNDTAVHKWSLAASIEKQNDNEGIKSLNALCYRLVHLGIQAEILVAGKSVLHMPPWCPQQTWESKLQ